MLKQIGIQSIMVRRQAYKPQPPKKPMCAFFIYRQDAYQQVKQMNPELRITQITTLISQKWKNLQPQIKQHYQQRARQQRQKFLRDRQNYEHTYGRVESKKARKKNLKKNYEMIKRFLAKRQEEQGRRNVDYNSQNN